MEYKDEDYVKMLRHVATHLPAYWAIHNGDGISPKEMKKYIMEDFHWPESTARACIKDIMGVNCVSLTKESRIVMYIPIPVCLLTSRFSSTTFLVYGSLLNSALLSRKNDWKDDSGEIYVRFSVEELAKFVGKGISTVKASLKELEDNGLIRRKRVDLYTTYIYVSVPKNCLVGQNIDSGKTENRIGKAQNSGLQTAGNMTTNNYTDIQNLYTDRYTSVKGGTL